MRWFLLMVLAGCSSDTTRQPDLAMPGDDLSMAADLAGVDLAGLDLAGPDLRIGDLLNPMSDDMASGTAVYFYVTSGTGGSVIGLSINSITGDATLIDQDVVAPSVQSTVPAGTNPISATATASGKFLYVPNYGSDSVSGYVIDAPSGRLLAIDMDSGTAGPQDLDTGSSTNPISIAVDPAGAYLYVAEFGASKVAAYSINSTTGVLSAVGSPVACGTEPRWVAVDSGGQLLFCVSQSGSVTAYTLAAGAPTPVDQDGVTGGVQPLFTGVDTGPIFALVHPSKQVLYVSADTANKVDALSFTSGGVLSQLDSDATGGLPMGAVLDPTATHLYVANYGSTTVSGFTVGADGSLTAIADATATNSGRAITIDPSGKFLYLQHDGGSLQIFSINSSTGALTAGTTVTSGGNGTYSFGVAHVSF